MNHQYLLARDGKTYLVSGWAFESEPIVRVLAYEVDAPIVDADGRAVNVDWAYSGPRRATYRTSTGLSRSFTYDPSKQADLVLDFPAHPPKCRKPVYWKSGAWCADYATGARRLRIFEDDYLRGYIAAMFTSGEPGITIPRFPAHAKARTDV